MNLELIINYLKNLESENIKLKETVLELGNTNAKLEIDLANLSKVSMISSMDKQIKEKLSTIEILERQLEKSNRTNLELKNNIFEKINIKDNEYLKDSDNNVYNYELIGTIKNNKFKLIKRDQ
jgi:predicted RNase H-like nuclease (RuvC/YqgF family)